MTLEGGIAAIEYYLSQTRHSIPGLQLLGDRIGCWRGAGQWGEPDKAAEADRAADKAEERPAPPPPGGDR